MRILPPIEERVRARLVDERPDTPAEARTECRSGQRAVLACGSDERRGFRHLVPQTRLGELLRPGDRAPECVEIGTLERVTGGRHEAAAKVSHGQAPVRARGRDDVKSALGGAEQAPAP